MFNSFFLSYYAPTVFIPDVDVFPYILLYLLSFCPLIYFFEKKPLPNIIVLQPSHLQPPLTVPRKKTAVPFPLRRRPCLVHFSSFPTKLSLKSTNPQILQQLVNQTLKWWDWYSHRLIASSPVLGYVTFDRFFHQMFISKHMGRW